MRHLGAQQRMPLEVPGLPGLCWAQCTTTLARSLVSTEGSWLGKGPGERMRLIPPGDRQASLGPLRERERGLLLLRGTAGPALLRRAGYVGLCGSDGHISHREEPGSRPSRSSS